MPFGRRDPCPGPCRFDRSLAGEAPSWDPRTPPLGPGPRPCCGPLALSLGRPLSRNPSLFLAFKGRNIPANDAGRKILQPLNYYYYPWTYAPISKGSAVRSADHDRQTPRRPRISGLVVSLSDPESAVPLRTYPQVYISSSTPIGRAGYSSQPRQPRHCPLRVLFNKDAINTQ